MRWEAAVCVLALAGCDVAAVKFVVDTSADPAVTEVRLYLGVGGGRDVELSPEGFEPSDPRREGRYWVQDVDGIVDAVEVPTPGTYSFVYTSTPDIEKLTAIAVGFDAQHVATSQAAVFEVKIPRDRVEVWTLALEPSAGAMPAATGPQVQVWGEVPGARTCAHAVNPGATHPIAYVVGSERDKDCDGFDDSDPLECDDLFFRAHPTSRADPNCITPVQVLASDGTGYTACSLGAVACTDGDPVRDACTANPRYCVIDETCSQCTDMQCVLDMWMDPLAWDCSIEVVRDDMTGKYRPCPQPIMLPAPEPTLACPVGPARYYPANGGSSGTTFEGFGMTLAFSALPGCVTKIQATIPAGGDVDANLDPFGGLVDLPAITGNHLVQPARFSVTPVPQCSGERTCSRTTANPQTLQPTCVDPAISPPELPI